MTTTRLGRPRIHSGPTVKRSARLPVGLDAQARVAAARQGISLSLWMTAAMELALRDRAGIQDALERIARRR